MRFALLAALALASCSSDPAPATDAGTDDTGAAVDLGTDTGPAPVDAGTDAGQLDAGAADTGIDTGAAPQDTDPRDAGAPQDTDPRQSEVCRGVTAECDGRRVNVQIGERDGGLVHHCGACGVTCRAGYVCDGCLCAR